MHLFFNQSTYLPWHPCVRYSRSLHVWAASILSGTHCQVSQFEMQVITVNYHRALHSCQICHFLVFRVLTAGSRRSCKGANCLQPRWLGKVCRLFIRGVMAWKRVAVVIFLAHRERFWRDVLKWAQTAGLCRQFSRWISMSGFSSAGGTVGGGSSSFYQARLCAEQVRTWRRPTQHLAGQQTSCKRAHLSFKSLHKTIMANTNTLSSCKFTTPRKCHNHTPLSAKPRTEKESHCTVAFNM